MPKTPTNKPRKAANRPDSRGRQAECPANGPLIASSGPEQGKRGNSRGNLRHGLKSGQMPKGAKYLEHRLNKFRRYLEDSVLALRGEVTLTDAAHIQSCIRWERHSLLSQRWLTKQYDELKPLERIRFSEEVAKASDKRDKSITALRLDRDTQSDVIEALYSKSTT